LNNIKEQIKDPSQGAKEQAKYAEEDDEKTEKQKDYINQLIQRLHKKALVI
jgi:hypothetical protein